MKVLALDSSGLVASVAVVEDDGVNGNLLAEYTVNYKKTHSQTLLPMLDEIAGMIELDLNTLDAIGVAGGPGSFTGLRIGSATAKGLGLALDKPLVHVPTVDALACNLYGTERLICPLMDARRNQVYTGIYEFRENRLEVLLPQTVTDIREIADLVRENKREMLRNNIGGRAAVVYPNLRENSGGKTEKQEEGQDNREAEGKPGGVLRLNESEEQVLREVLTEFLG